MYIELDSPFGKPSLVDPTTGEILFDDGDRLDAQLATVARSNAGEQSKRIRRFRFKLQRLARKALIATSTPKGNRWRVCDCMRLPNPTVRDLFVTRSGASGRADLRHLIRCGNVWTCPVCATKVAGTRRDEVKTALDQHLGQGKLALMVTLTTRHKRDDALQLVLDGIGAASKRLRAHRAVRDLRKSYGFVGQIRALEVTWGQANGWHPHFHEVWLFDVQRNSVGGRAVNNSLRRQLPGIWVGACEAEDLRSPSLDRGCDVSVIERSSDYIGKGIAAVDPDREAHRWGVADEVARWSSKSARKADRCNPFDLLEDGRVDLFRDYARAFYGKRQLTWSPRLKKRFGIGDITDEQAAALEEPDAQPVIGIPADDWRPLVRRRPEVVPELLELVETQGVTAAVDFLQANMVEAWAYGPEHRLRDVLMRNPRSKSQLPRLIVAATFGPPAPPDKGGGGLRPPR